MSRSTPRLAAVGVVVLVLGMVRGVESNLDVVLAALNAGGNFTLHPSLDVLLMGTFLFGGALLGYVWGRDADVGSAYVSLLVVVTVALMVGYGVGYAFVAVLSILGPGELFPFSFVTALLWDVSFFVTSLHLPLVALAGAAVANYHAPADRTSPDGTSRSTEG